MFSERKKLVMCPSCRALVEASASACPLCGRESVPSLSARVSATTGNPYFISFIILTINVLLFVLMAVVEVRNGRGAEAFIDSASNPVLDDFGALLPPAVAAGQLWRLVTMNFLHIGLMHLLFNSSALYQIGPQVEELYGSQKFVFIYMLTGIFSGIASFFFNIGGAGASGAIFGLIGLMVVYGYKQGGTYGKAITRQMLTWAAFGFIFGAMIHANNVAHAGGFIAGACLGYLVKPGAATTHRASSGWNAAAIASVLALVLSFVMAGRSYGAMQNLAREDEIKMRAYEARRQQGEQVIYLSERIREASKAWEDSIGMNLDKQDPQKVVENLSGAASAIESLPQIDESSGEIRKRIIALLNTRADAFRAALHAPAARKDTALLLAATSDLEEGGKAFESYFDWEESVLDKYGLVRGKN